MSHRVLEKPASSARTASSQLAAPVAPGHGSSPRRADIEGLRALAILLVVAFHVGLPGSRGGFIGVDVFFVLSGYLITGLLVDEFERTGGIRLFDFYARRVRRLLPASAFVLLVTLLGVLLIYSPFEQVSLSRTALATSTYLSNVWFLRRASDYFGADVETNPLLHTWSLAVEEQFYLVWPLLLAAGLKWGGSRRRLGIVMAIVSAPSFVAALYVTRALQPVAFFGTPLRAWEFGIGGLVSLAPRTAALRPNGAHALLSWGGLALVLGAGVVLSAQTPFPGSAALAPVLGTAALLHVGATGQQPSLRRFLESPPMQWLGGLSYSWYLWHWPVLVLAAALLPFGGVGVRAALAVLALALAYATHRLLENPIRFNRRLVARPRTSLMLAAALTVLTASAAIGAGRHARRVSATPSQAAYARAMNERPQMDRDGCTIGFDRSEPRLCEYGDASAATTIVLFGDSHASQWFPALEDIARRRGWRLVTLAKSSCVAAEVPVYSKALKRDFTECTAWRDAALRRIEELHPAAVVIGNLARREPRDVGADGEYRLLTPQEWQRGIRRTVAGLAGAGVPSLLIRDTPAARFDVPMCLSRATARRYFRPDCRIARSDALDDSTAAAERAALSGIGNAAYLDLSDRFCDSVACPPLIDGMAVYRDAHHISVAFARRLVPAVEAALDGVRAQ